MYQLQELAISLAEAQWEGRSFTCSVISGDPEVLQVTLSDGDEIPLYVTITDTQILCIAYLFKKEEVKDEMLNRLNDQCLQLNIPMPLSAFATVGNQYTLFGALSTSSTFENIQKELVTLGENAVETLEALEDYLK
jgi:uncharacterized protein YjfI (DUF2170 family)